LIKLFGRHAGSNQKNDGKKKYFIHGLYF